MKTYESTAPGKLQHFYVSLLASAVALLIILTGSPMFAAASSAAAEKKQPGQQAGKEHAFSDRDMLVAIETEFEFNPAVDGRLVDVNVKDGIVTLTGKVDNLLARDRAAEVAGAIRGVRGVSNQIVVDPIARSDKELQQAVNLALARNPTTESFQNRRKRQQWDCAPRRQG